MGVVGAEHSTKETFADMSGARRKNEQQRKHPEVQVFEERVDLSNDMTWRQMIAVGVRIVVLARGELDKLEGPKYAARTEEGRVAPKGGRSRESKGSAGGGGVAG